MATFLWALASKVRMPRAFETDQLALHRVFRPTRARSLLVGWPRPAGRSVIEVLGRFRPWLSHVDPLSFQIDIAGRPREADLFVRVTAGRTQ
jgi:hypothetical protein